MERFGKPIVGILLSQHWMSPFPRHLLNHGVTVFPEPERAARALEAVARYAELRKNLQKDGANGSENGSELVGKIPL